MFEQRTPLDLPGVDRYSFTPPVNRLNAAQDAAASGHNRHSGKELPRAKVN
jgi:hypothetical protein